MRGMKPGSGRRGAPAVRVGRRAPSAFSARMTHGRRVRSDRFGCERARGATPAAVEGIGIPDARCASAHRFVREAATALFRPGLRRWGASSRQRRYAGRPQGSPARSPSHPPSGTSGTPVSTAVRLTSGASGPDEQIRCRDLPQHWPSRVPGVLDLVRPRRESERLRIGRGPGRRDATRWTTMRDRRGRLDPLDDTRYQQIARPRIAAPPKTNGTTTAEACSPLAEPRYLCGLALRESEGSAMLPLPERTEPGTRSSAPSRCTYSTTVALVVRRD